MRPKSKSPARKAAGKGGQRGQQQQRKKEEKKKPMTAEEMDAEMDSYWMKSGDKKIAGKVRISWVEEERVV